MQSYIKVLNHISIYSTIYQYIEPYIKVLNHISIYLTIYEYTQSYIKVLNHIYEPTQPYSNALNHQSTQPSIYSIIYQSTQPHINLCKHIINSLNHISMYSTKVQSPNNMYIFILLNVGLIESANDSSQPYINLTNNNLLNSMYSAIYKTTEPNILSHISIY